MGVRGAFRQPSFSGFQTAKFLGLSGFQTAKFLGLSDSQVSREAGGFQTAKFLVRPGAFRQPSFS
jgi:hypothetical protein